MHPTPIRLKESGIKKKVRLIRVSGHKNLLFRIMKIRLINPNNKSLLSVVLILVALSAYAQNTGLVKYNSRYNSPQTEINSHIQQQADIIKSVYSENIETPKELINGKEYESYYTRSKIKPLLFSNKERTASIFTNTRSYNNLTLQYDTFLDEVIYTDTSRTFNYRFPQISLNKNIIDGFNLYFQDDSIIFKNFRLPECSEKNLKEGFYEVAYEGKSQYVIKHESTFYVREGLKNYKYSPKNYISVSYSYFRIQNRRSFIRIFGEQSGYVKDFLNQYGIKVSKASKDQIIRVLKFYDSLANSDR